MTDDQELETSATAYALSKKYAQCPACGESTFWDIDRESFIAGAKWAREEALYPKDV